MTQRSLRHIWQVAAVVVILCENSVQKLYGKQILDIAPAFPVERIKDTFVNFSSSQEYHDGNQTEDKEDDFLLPFKETMGETVQAREINGIRSVRQATYAMQTVPTNTYMQMGTNSTHSYSLNQQSTYPQTAYPKPTHYPLIGNVNGTPPGQWSQYPSYQRPSYYYPNSNSTTYIIPSNLSHSNSNGSNSHHSHLSYPSSNNHNYPSQSLNSFPNNTQSGNYQPHLRYPTSFNYPSSRDHNYTGQLSNSSNGFPSSYTNKYPSNSQPVNYQPYPSGHDYPLPGSHHYPGQSLNFSHGFRPSNTNNYPGNTQQGNYQPYPTSHAYPSPGGYHHAGHFSQPQYPNSNSSHSPKYPINKGQAMTITTTVTNQTYPTPLPKPGNYQPYPTSHAYSTPGGDHYPGQSSNSPNGFLSNYTNKYPSNTQPGNYQPYPSSDGYPSPGGHHYPGQSLNFSHGFRPSNTNKYPGNTQQGNYQPYPTSHAYPSPGDHHYQGYSSQPQYPSSNSSHSPHYPVNNGQPMTVTTKITNLTYPIPLPKPDNYQPYPSSHGYPLPGGDHYLGQSSNSSKSFQLSNTNNYPVNMQSGNYQPYKNASHAYPSPGGHYYPGHSSYPHYPSSNSSHSPQYPVNNDQTMTATTTTITNQTFNRYPSNKAPNTNGGNLYFYPAQNTGPNVDPTKVNPREFA